MMASMLSLIASPLARLLAGAVLGGLLLLSAYGWGRHEGGQAAKRAQLAATVAAMEQRKLTDAQITDMDRYSVCIAVGGLPDECIELRGVDKSAEAE